MSDEKYAAFHKKLLAAQKQMSGGVSHDARNDFARFDYTSSEAIIASSSKAMSDAGLTFVHDWEYSTERSEVIITCEVSDGGHVMVRSYNFPVFEQKGKPIDKALAGAVTTCLAYALRGILNFPRPDKSDDIAARDDEKFEPKARLHKPKPEPAFDGSETAKLRIARSYNMATKDFTSEEWKNFQSMTKQDIHSYVVDKLKKMSEEAKPS